LVGRGNFLSISQLTKIRSIHLHPLFIRSSFELTGVCCHAEIVANVFWGFHNLWEVYLRRNVNPIYLVIGVVPVAVIGTVLEMGIY